MSSVNLGDDTKCTQPDDHAVETWLTAANVDQFAGCGDHLQAGNRRRQRAGGIAGPVRTGGNGAGDGDVWKGGHVVQRPSLCVQTGG